MLWTPSSTPPNRKVTTPIFVVYCAMILLILGWGLYDYTRTDDLVSLVGVVALGSSTTRIAFLSFKWFEHWYWQLLSMLGGFTPFAAAWVGLTLHNLFLALVIGVVGLVLNVVIPWLEYKQKLRSVWRWQKAPWVPESPTTDTGTEGESESTVRTAKDDSGASRGVVHSDAAVAVGDASRDSGGDDGRGVEGGVTDDGGEERSARARGVGGAAGEVVQEERTSASVRELVEDETLEPVPVRRQRSDEQANHDETQEHEECGLDHVGDDQRERQSRDDVDEQKQQHSPDEQDHAGSAAGTVAPVLAEDDTRAVASAPDLAGSEPAVEDGRLAEPEERQQPAK